MAERERSPITPTDHASDIRRARQSSRTVVDGSIHWHVYELPAPAYDRRRGPSLIFEHELGMRRVRNYPADWRSLTDAALLELARGI
ncbi:MAG TPA: hypothetical protein VEA99_15265 [Gemmatimonadaceae bacterium]|nr:hypothetical protein [Gemmatimonadaceae bacterium]